MEERNYFTVTSHTYHPNFFPKNNLNQFSSPLPTQIELKNYEVALQSVTFPRDMEEMKEKFMVSTPYAALIWELDDFEDTKDFVIRAKIGCQRTKNILFGVNRDNDTNEIINCYFERIVRNLDEDDPDFDSYHKPFWIRVSIPFLRACGQLWSYITVKPLLPGEKWIFGGKPNINLAYPGDIAALHCSVIQPNMVGNTQAHLLQLIPIKEKKERKNFNFKTFYEPETLIYHPVIERPFSHISFQFLESDGRRRRLETEDNELTDMYITLVFRKIKK